MSRKFRSYIQGLIYLQARGGRKGDTSSVCVNVYIVCMRVCACGWEMGGAGWIMTPQSKCTLYTHLMDTVHKYAVECIESTTCAPHDMG